MPFEKYYQDFLDNNPHPRTLKTTQPDFESASSVYLYLNKRRLINFSANDYLGLARHPLLIARSGEYAQRWGTGATASRLVTGNYTIFAELEEQLAHALGKPAALIFGAGYQTNISVLEALFNAEILGSKPLIFADKFAHVSMLASVNDLGTLRRFQHNDTDHLKKLLEKYSASTSPIFILIESLYSMDGDRADLVKIIELAQQHQAFLYVDDAHALGVYGPDGWGFAAHHKNIDMVMGTFSKGLGSFGGFIACSAVMRDFLVNKCRGLIYSTALSPAVLGAISGAIELLPQLHDARLQLQRKADYVRNFFRKNNLDFGNSDTHIIPWIIGDADLTVRASALLEDEGILASAIRPPTVAAGKSRIRLCLSAAHTDADINELLSAIAKILLVIQQ